MNMFSHLFKYHTGQSKQHNFACLSIHRDILSLFPRKAGPIAVGGGGGGGGVGC